MGNDKALGEGSPPKWPSTSLDDFFILADSRHTGIHNKCPNS